MKDISELKLNESKRAQRAMQLFNEGYNCAQAVFLTFSDLYEMDEKQVLRLSSSFGGGMGRLREVCGTVSGMFMVCGMLYGYDDPKEFEGKKELYQRIQKLAKEFEEYNGSIICRILLGLDHKKDEAVPEKRTEEYYQKRPCGQLCGIAAAIMEKHINEEANRNE